MLLRLASKLPWKHSGECGENNRHLLSVVDANASVLFGNIGAESMRFMVEENELASAEAE
jgi:hypothetical protein